MTMNVFVGSKMNGSVYHVEGNGMTEIDARRNAIQIGRAMHHIGDPIALSDHEAAVRMRQLFIAQYAPKMPLNMNGNEVSLSKRREDPRYR